MSAEKLTALNRVGVLGFGQGFQIKSQCDGQEAPAGHDLLTAKAVDLTTEVVVDENPVRAERYHGAKIGQPYEPHSAAYFVYEIETRVDSSD